MEEQEEELRGRGEGELVEAHSCRHSAMGSGLLDCTAEERVRVFGLSLKLI